MMFKNSKHPNEAWALMKYLSGDAVQTQYANLMGMFPARLAPQKQVGETDTDHRAFFSAIQQGRTYAPIPQWAQIENAYKNRLGAILDSAAGQGKPFTRSSLESQLHDAAKEADSLLAQSTG
jgi:multiple sugar transport system substrate-binding protein